MKALVKLALIVGGVAVAAKLVAAKKAEWTGLSESEVREKLESRLPQRVPDEKRAAVADKVVSKMRQRGAFRDDGEPSAAEQTDSGPGEEEPGSEELGGSDDSTQSL